MTTTTNSIIIKFENAGSQTVENVTKIVGLVKARYLVPVIDCLNLEANPRASKTGSVTEAIQETLRTNPALFPFMSKGILLASSQYQLLERNRIRITPDDPNIEGILDGGHNTLAIGLYILGCALEKEGITLTKKSKTWDEFKEIWIQNRDIIENYLNDLAKDPSNTEIDFYVPVELLVPRLADDASCIYDFKNELLNICAARNNNVQLRSEAKANQRGYFDYLKELVHQKDADLYNRIEWKTNDGGDIKAQDLIALAWIPLNLIDPVTSDDDSNKKIDHISPVKLYSSKGACLSQFEKLMSSPDVTYESDDDYKRVLCNDQVEAALKIAVELPTLYDYIYKHFPDYYNSTGGLYGRITAVKTLNEKRKVKVTPFTGVKVSQMSPEGFIIPIVYGLQAIMEMKLVNGKQQIVWKTDPHQFLIDNLEKVVHRCVGNMQMVNYDPQKVGKTLKCYTDALDAYKMAYAGWL